MDNNPILIKLYTTFFLIGDMFKLIHAYLKMVDAVDQFIL